MPREPQKKKGVVGVIKCQKPRHEVLLQMKSHNHPSTDIFPLVCINNHANNFIKYVLEDMVKQFFFFFFLLKQFSGSCYLHP
jgi:hypothetical protein